METLLTIIVFSVISLLVIMINTVVTKELKEALENSWLDRPMFYRVCLIPPIGFAVFWIFTLFIVIVFIINMISDICK